MAWLGLVLPGLAWLGLAWAGWAGLPQQSWLVGAGWSWLDYCSELLAGPGRVGLLGCSSPPPWALLPLSTCTPPALSCLAWLGWAWPGLAGLVGWWELAGLHRSQLLAGSGQVGLLGCSFPPPGRFYP